MKIYLHNGYYHAEWRNMKASARKREAVITMMAKMIWEAK